MLNQHKTVRRAEPEAVQERYHDYSWQNIGTSKHNVYGSQKLFHHMVSKVWDNRWKPEKWTELHMQVVRKGKEVWGLCGKVPDHWLSAYHSSQRPGNDNIFVTNLQDDPDQIGAVKTKALLQCCLYQKHEAVKLEKQGSCRAGEEGKRN